MITILIPCRNASATLERCLKSVLGQRTEKAFEIIVIDDGSSDGSADIAEKMGAQVIRLNAMGRPAALNAGLQIVKGDIVLFIDADCEAPVDWVEAWSRILDADQNLAGAGGNLWPSGSTPSEQSKLLPYLDEFERERDLTQDERRVALNANNMAIRKSALHKIDGFDGALLHGADADLTRRLLAAGFRLKRVLEPRVTHLKQDRLPDLCATAYRRGSTVAVHMKAGDFTWLDLIKGFFQPFAQLISGYIRLPRLRRLLPGVPLISLLLAPLAGFMAGWFNAVGRLDYYLKFKKVIGQS